MKKAGGILALLLGMFLAAGDAEARCYKCRDQACFMSEGTNSWCEPLTNGCFAGGTCGGASDCGEFYCGPEDQGVELQLPLGSEYRLVAVAVTHERQAVARIAAVRPSATGAPFAPER